MYFGGNICMYFGGNICMYFGICKNLLETKPTIRCLTKYFRFYNISQIYIH